FRIAIYDNYQRSVLSLSEKYRVGSLSGLRKAGKQRLPAGRDPAGRLHESSMLSQIEKEFANCGMDQGLARIKSTRFVVEYPGSTANAITRPPAASTSSRPGMKWDQSAPFTRISGRSAAINSRGVSSSKSVTASTHASEPASSARSPSEISGRASPFIRRTEA